MILVAGRFRGKRVVLLKNLDQGVLLVTGPFKINGVPLRRVNAKYVIATSEKVDLAGVDSKKIEEIAAPDYFTADKAKEKAGEEAFFQQGEKPQVRCAPPAISLSTTTSPTATTTNRSPRPRRARARAPAFTHMADPPLQKKAVATTRVADQKAIDKALIANIKKVELLGSYLATSFSLRKGDKPHEMKW